ncbi:T-cell-interacting, activating receptor on myeloid cells protein 1-like isoform X2 [Numida meleagris]|uniref:T-cell-interacting, activating receptor on myeloid cells protein 1-like isoform X2 n=1 Tax=Numida meleagris TaxID=8996 RepID=UPI000B3E3F05|nr:T-cell-interacting, activating receptor on myeloid cells protein 1-like isoform X2 [Numida meleagris]
MPLAGWCLVAASRAQQLPQPSLSLHPSQGVSLGDTVTLRCHLPQLAAWVWLYQEGGGTYSKSKDKQQDSAEFSFVSTNREHTGTYQCQYWVSESEEISEQSDPVQLVVTGEGTGDSRWFWVPPTEPCPNAVPFPYADRSFPPPSISLHTKEYVGKGTNVTIWCRNKAFGATFLLHKDGHSAPVQHQDSNLGGTATFTLFGVTPADTGTYQCSYRPWRYPFVSSPLGSSVTLEVAPTPAPPGATFTSHGNLVALVAGGCTAAFVFILILVVFFLLAARRRRIRRDESPGSPTRNPEAMEFQVPPGDSESLTYIKLQAVTPSTQHPTPPAAPQPSVIYAKVATGGHH